MARPEHLPFDLLETFSLIAELEGDAAATAAKLGINQPSISKRLAALRRLTSGPDHQPWLFLRGKSWRLTPEGERVRGVVDDLVRRYGQVEQFVAGGRSEKPRLAIACGQQAANGFVRRAVERFATEDPACRVRIATPRGPSRIEGVADGLFDLAVVSEDPAAIPSIARREMFVETLFEDRFLLAANPAAKAPWAAAWQRLPKAKPIEPTQLVGMPLIVPEPDAARRKQFEHWFAEADQTLDARIEIGGWTSILNYAAAGLGIGLTTESAVTAFEARAKLTARPLAESSLPPNGVSLVARKAHGKNQPELTPRGETFRRCLREAARSIH
ncbi:MAG TPA: LysR family transcriptional regulator [Gemmataceae bacterium]|jgi:DNA-binding transcriptional LysR family regulator